MKFFTFLFCIISYVVFAQKHTAHFDVYLLTDTSKQMQLQEVLLKNNFKKIQDLSTLNFGISKNNQWLKIVVQDCEQNIGYKLKLATITLDTVEVYEAFENKIIKTLIGESIPSNERFLNYNFKSTNKTNVVYLKITGDGQPIALSITIEKSFKTGNEDFIANLIAGILYGIVVFILIVNGIMFILSRNKLYVYSFLYVLFSSLLIVYFEGLIKFFLIPNSGYWNNLSIMLFLSGSFITVNFYIREFLNIDKSFVLINKIFSIFNILFIFTFLIALWQPNGFAIAVFLNIFMCTVEAILFTICIFSIREKDSYIFKNQFVAVLFLIIFGSICQLYFAGILPVNYITKYAIHCMVFPQIIVQTFALGQRFAIKNRQHLQLQAQLLKTSEQHSQSLISTLENERKRLSADFHDSIGQNLLVIRNQILLLIKSKNASKSASKLNDIAQITSETLDEIRLISQNLRPTTLETIGLKVTLKNMFERIMQSSNININFICDDGIDKISIKDFDIYIYRIIQELINNVLKHSQAKNVLIKTAITSSVFTLNFGDDGIGFNPNKIMSDNVGNGIAGITERINILKGKIAYINDDNIGTFVKIQIPINDK